MSMKAKTEQKQQKKFFLERQSLPEAYLYYKMLSTCPLFIFDNVFLSPQNASISLCHYTL